MYVDPHLENKSRLKKTRKFSTPDLKGGQPIKIIIDAFENQNLKAPAGYRKNKYVFF